MNRKEFMQQAALAGLFITIPTAFAGAFIADNRKQTEAVFDKLRAFITAQTGIALDESFYSQWAPGYQYYVYVSLNNAVERPENEPYYRFFGSNAERAMAVKAEYDAKGFDTLLYKTAATSAAKIFSPLEFYPAHCLSFIGLHEAHHIHHRSKNEKNIPYSFEEAAGDVLGNYLSIAFSRQYPELVSEKAARHQIKVNEDLYRHIIKTRKLLDKHKSADRVMKKLENYIADKLKNEDNFKKDRFVYPVNYAFFIRYGYYTANYFLLTALYHKLGDAKAFIAFLDTLPADEEKAKKMCAEKIKSRENSSRGTLLHR